MLLYIMMAFAVAADQLTKIWIRHTLPLGDTTAFWPGVLQFTHIENTGAAGSSFAGYGRWFIPVAIIVTVWAVYAERKGRLRQPLLAAGVGLFVGGAIGNAIDRTLYNQVTDFLEWNGGHGIMNIADLLLNVGMLLGVASLILSRQSKSPQAASKS